MAAQDDIQALAQSVYLRIKNRQFDNITSTDGQQFVANIVDFANGFIDELENELDANGNPINWWWVRHAGYTLGTASTGAASIAFPVGVNNLIAEEERYVQILQDGTAVSNWVVVAPNQISNGTNRVTQDMCARVGSNIVFSRQFNSTEQGGTIVGDVTTPIPRLVFGTTSHAADDSQAIATILPRELFVLGIAKNASLPDIVQGKLSPNLAQKFNDLLTNSIARSTVSALADLAEYEDLSFISGVGF